MTCRAREVGDLGFEPRLTESESEHIAIQGHNPQRVTRSDATGCSAGCSDQQGEGGIPDADLAAIVAAWPTLPQALRLAVLAIVRMAITANTPDTPTKLEGG